MPSLYKMNYEPEVAEVLEAMRSIIANNFGVTLTGNRLTLRWNHNGHLVHAHMIIEEVRTPTESQPPRRIETPSYVLVYVGDQDEWRFFKDGNLYLGVANLTDSLEYAAMMTLDEAERKWGCMSIKADWQIWSVKTEIVLDAISDRHRYAEIHRAKKAALEEELKSLMAREET